MMRDTSEKHSNKIQAWERNGNYKDWAKVYQYGGDLATVVYKHNTPKKSIQEITLFSEHCHEVQIKLSIHESRYEAFGKYITAHGYPKPNRYSYSYYYIQIPNIKYLSDFLEVLAQADHDISLIADEIVENIKPVINNEPTIPGWLKSGSFANHPYVNYKNCLSDSKVEELELSMSLYSGTTNLTIIAKDTAGNAIVKALKDRAVIVTQESKYSGTHNIYCKIGSQNDLLNALASLYTVEKSVQQIMTSISKCYDEKMQLMRIAPVDNAPTRMMRR